MKKYAALADLPDHRSMAATSAATYIDIRQFPDFAKIRGRVALAYVNYMILGGRVKAAHNTWQRLRTSMPRNFLYRLLTIADRCGFLGCIAASLFIEGQERLKAFIASAQGLPAIQQSTLRPRRQFR